MNLFPMIAGAVFLAAGAAGLVITQRVNGSVLAGFTGTASAGTDTGGFVGDGEDFSYEGTIDHAPGARRRLLAGFLLLLLVIAVGALLAGGVMLMVRLLFSAFSQFLPE